MLDLRCHYSIVAARTRKLALFQIKRSFGMCFFQVFFLNIKSKGYFFKQNNVSITISV